MANIKSQIKRIKTNERNRLRNQSAKSSLRTAIRHFREAVEALEKAGASVVEIETPNFKYALGAYYLIMSSEVSSNLAKYDGVRFGQRALPKDGHVTIERVMSATRAENFGAEVKRRTILGTYALSAGYYDAYYGSAQKVRTLVQRDFAAAYEQADVLVSPTAPTTAFPLGSRLDDPLAMYAADIATSPTAAITSRRPRAGDRLMPDQAGGARPVVHHHRLAEPGRQMLRQQPRQHRGGERTDRVVTCDSFHLRRCSEACRGSCGSGRFPAICA